MLNSGEEAPLGELVECIVTAQGAGFSGAKENGHDINEVSCSMPYVLYCGCCLYLWISISVDMK